MDTAFLKLSSWHSLSSKSSMLDKESREGSILFTKLSNSNRAAGDSCRLEREVISDLQFAIYLSTASIWL
jgi:hypothetical protein